MRPFKNAFTSDPVKIESAFYVLLIPSPATIPCLVLFTVLTCQIADCVGSSHSRLQEPLNSKHDMQMKLPALLRFMWIISASTLKICLHQKKSRATATWHPKIVRKLFAHHVNFV